MPPNEKAQAVEVLMSQIIEQRIEFAFRKTELTPNAKKVLQVVAQALAVLPEFTLRVEGHSNFIPKNSHKLTAEDQERMKRLSQERAEECKKVLEGAGVQNPITCVGLGADHKQSKGCVKLVPFASTATDAANPPAVPEMPQKDVEEPEKAEPAVVAEPEKAEASEKTTEEEKAEEKVVSAELAATVEDVPPAAAADVELAVEVAATPEPSQRQEEPVCEIAQIRVSNVQDTAPEPGSNWLQCCSSKPSTSECPMGGKWLK